MGGVEGSRTFGVSGASYDAFMGRYSRPLAEQLADAVGATAGETAIDVGCGPGALTNVLVARLGASAVRACDPSPRFCDDCATSHPGVVVARARAEALPFETASVDHALAQLVLHFVSDPGAAAREMARVVRPGGRVAACVWDSGDGMEMLRAFWDAASSIDPDAPDEGEVLSFGRSGELADLFAAARLADVEESTLAVTSSYTSFDALWDGFLAGVGPAGSYCVSLPATSRQRLYAALFARLGAPSGPFTLRAVARFAMGRAPD